MREGAKKSKKKQREIVPIKEERNGKDDMFDDDDDDMDIEEGLEFDKVYDPKADNEDMDEEEVTIFWLIQKFTYF